MENIEIKTVPIYCTSCVATTAHSYEQDGNGQMVAHCTNVMIDDPKNPGQKIGHTFVKFPAVDSAEELQTLIANREIVNRPHAEMVEKHKKQQAIWEEVLKSGAKATITSDTPVETPPAVA